jgi:hypothetical protein
VCSEAKKNILPMATPPPTIIARAAPHFHGLLHATKTLEFLINLILFS